MNAISLKLIKLLLAPILWGSGALIPLITVSWTSWAGSWWVEPEGPGLNLALNFAAANRNRTANREVQRQKVQQRSESSQSVSTARSRTPIPTSPIPISTPKTRSPEWKSHLKTGWLYDPNIGHIEQFRDVCGEVCEIKAANMRTIREYAMEPNGALYWRIRNPDDRTPIDYFESKFDNESKFESKFDDVSDNDFGDFLHPTSRKLSVNDESSQKWWRKILRDGVEHLVKDKNGKDKTETYKQENYKKESYTKKTSTDGLDKGLVNGLAKKNQQFGQSASASTITPGIDNVPPVFLPTYAHLPTTSVTEKNHHIYTTIPAKHAAKHATISSTHAHSDNNLVNCTALFENSALDASHNQTNPISGTGETFAPGLPYSNT
jgi:hypothetical protein